jgi:hypothetical protein
MKTADLCMSVVLHASHRSLCIDMKKLLVCACVHACICSQHMFVLLQPPIPSPLTLIMM